MRFLPRARRSALCLLIGLAALPTAIVGLSQPAQATEARFPVVLIPGWLGAGDLTYQELIPKLQAQGYTVIDFDQTRAGVQAMSYAPTAQNQHISYLSGKVIQPKIQAALAANGYPANQKVDIIAHSMGGLATRFLLEQPGADVDGWNAAGWTGDGVADIATDWAARVDDLVMIGTPNHGTWEGWVGSKLPNFVNWNTSAGDMAVGSTFVNRMGYAEKAGEHYTCIGGDPWYLQAFKYDFDGDGIKHGFDGVVPAESPFLTGCDNSFVAENHLGQVGADSTVGIINQAFSVTGTPNGSADNFLAGTASVRIEYAQIVQDHDFGTTDDYRFDVYVDPDGGGDSYVLANTIAQAFDGPATRNWGDTGPQSAGINLPGTSPTMDVKLVVWEDDGIFGAEPVSTVYFNNTLLSEDNDGMDYYQATASDAKGGTNTFRVSVNGVTSNLGATRLVTFSMDKALVQDDLDDIFSGNAEAQFTLNAGRDGFAGTFYRGSPADGTYYSRASNTWVTMGTDAKNNGAKESKVVFKGRMLNSAAWRFDAEYFDDDGGWSARDSGGKYQWTGAVSSLAAGRTNLTGTAFGAWDVYLYIDVAG
jgi:pimeloyl-ACP methyl ester carboxylesterase